MAKLGFIAMLMLCTASYAQTPADNETSYQLTSGDRLRVTVFGHEDLSGEFLVDAQGRISMPLIGDVLAAGASLDELEASIEAIYQPDYLRNPRVSAELVSYRPFYIIGEVNSPGSYAFENGMTVINAVAIAGGYTYRARKKAIVITREVDSQVVRIEADQDTVVLPGDSIEVPERFF